MTMSSTDKQQTRCTTCRGYGLWAMGDPVPMGWLDAEDGMPTMACPECGANPNPFPDEPEVADEQH